MFKFISKIFLFSLIINCFHYIDVDAGGNGPCCPRQWYQWPWLCNGYGKCNAACCNCDGGPNCRAIRNLV